VLQGTRLFLGANDPTIHLAGDEEARQSPSVGNQRKRRGKNQGGDEDEKSDAGPEEGEDESDAKGKGGDRKDKGPEEQDGNEGEEKLGKDEGLCFLLLVSICALARPT